jgi:uncharacterized MAPEG superfamily protein
MASHVTYLVASAGLCWVQLLSASLLHAKGWTPAGLQLAFGNREEMPPVTPLVGRAKRAANNMVEAMVLLCAVMLAANMADAPARAIDRGAAVFFWSRVVYTLLYLGGVGYLRTAAWFASLGGIAMIGAAALG